MNLDLITLCGHDGMVREVHRVRARHHVHLVAHRDGHEVDQLRPNQRETRVFAPQFSRAIQEENLDQAISLAEKNKKSHVARVVGEALAEVKPLLRDRATITAADINSAERAVERQMLIVLAEFKRGTGILATVGSTAPFVGLLGTTMGIINAFTGMAARARRGGLAGISAGIAEALITTALRPAGRHSGGVGLQLLHDQDREPHGRDDLRLEGADRLPHQERRQRVRPLDLHARSSRRRRRLPAVAMSG